MGCGLVQRHAPSADRQDRRRRPADSRGQAGCVAVQRGGQLVLPGRQGMEHETPVAAGEDTLVAVCRGAAEPAGGHGRHGGGHGGVAADITGHRRGEAAADAASSPAPRAPGDMGRSRTTASAIGCPVDPSVTWPRMSAVDFGGADVAAEGAPGAWGSAAGGAPATTRGVTATNRPATNAKDVRVTVTSSVTGDPMPGGAPARRGRANVTGYPNGAGGLQTRRGHGQPWISTLTVNVRSATVAPEADSWNDAHSLPRRPGRADVAVEFAAAAAGLTAGMQAPSPEDYECGGAGSAAGLNSSSSTPTCATRCRPAARRRRSGRRLQRDDRRRQPDSTCSWSTRASTHRLAAREAGGGRRVSEGGRARI